MLLGLRRSVLFFSLLALTTAACGQEGVPRPDPYPTSSASTSSSSGVGGAGGAGGMMSGTGGAGGGTSTGAGGGTSTGAGGGCTSGSAPPVIVSMGSQPGSLLLKGTVVTPDQVFAGEVLVVDENIACAAPSCAGAVGAMGATVVDTKGIIFPGLIDTHNHILYDIFDESDWAPTQSYTNHNQWPNDARYGAMVDCKQYINGEGSSPVDFGCELDKYGELKGLIAGTTSIVGAATPANRSCYGSLSRTIDQSSNGLGADAVQVATLFPNSTSANGVCTNFTSGKTHAYLIHIAEGVDQSALNEFTTLGTVTTPDGCLYDPKTAIVHGTALGDTELQLMAQSGMSLVWSPRSNVFLYGAGTDLSKTTDIPLALSKGINIALAPDWSLGGSQNLLDELRFADMLDNTMWGDVLSPKMLVEMVTTNAAKALGLSSVLGSIEVGKKADLMVVSGDAAAPYDALLAATPADVRLVLVGGTPLYGDAALKAIGPASPGCEDLDVCCQSKFVCVAAPGGTATNKLGQTYAEIVANLTTALTDYDALGLSQWSFSPLVPLVKCP